MDPPEKRVHSKKYQHIHTRQVSLFSVFQNMSFSSFVTCSKSVGMLYFRLPFHQVYSRTLEFCSDDSIVESHDIDECDNNNILVFLSDGETIVELHVSANTHVDDYVTEISIVCLDGDTDSAGYFAGFFFDLHNFIVDLIAV